jgi:hypothetical protein
MAEIVRVEGLADVKLALINVPIHLRKKVMYRLLRKAAAPILRAAKANAPVAKKATRRVIPGLVRGMMKISTSRYWKPQKGEFGVYIKPVSPSKIKRLQKTAKKQGASVYFGDPYYYRFQEYGFHAVGRDRIRGSYKRKRRNIGISMSQRARRNAQYSAGLHTKVPGLKFIGRAFESQKNAALNIIKADLVAEILSAFNKNVNKKGIVNG